MLKSRGGMLTGAVGMVALVLWRIEAARRERRRLEALVVSRTRQLRQSEELFRSIFEHATEGIFQSSLDGGNLRANPAMTAICGFSSPEEVSQGYTDAATQFYVQPGRRDEINAEVALRGAAVGWESEVWRKDGSSIWISENVRLVADPATGEMFYLGSLVDITARREMQAAQEQARLAAEAASAAKSRFLAHMTHELRTPLTGVLSSARVALRDPALDEGNRQRYARIAESGEHLLRLIEEVLDFSRLEAHRMQIRPAPFNLAELLRALVEDFQPRAGDARLEFRCEAAPALPKFVRGDVLRLRQVLDNLIGNALKFTNRGQIKLGVCHCGRAAGGPEPCVRFEVTDTGIGIPAQELEAIFEPFQQAPVPGRTTAGAGLGLNISARLVALMDGELQVESTPGEGSRFFFEIALPDAEAGETLREDPADTGVQPVPGEPAAGAPGLPPPAEEEIDALIALSWRGDIVRLRARLEELAAADPAQADFARDLDRLAAAFRMNAVSEFLGNAKLQRAARDAGGGAL
jgi:PAS domain S-box-containing protein